MNFKQLMGIALWTNLPLEEIAQISHTIISKSTHWKYLEKLFVNIDHYVNNSSEKKIVIPPALTIDILNGLGMVCFYNKDRNFLQSFFGGKNITIWSEFYRTHEFPIEEKISIEFFKSNNLELNFLDSAYGTDKNIKILKASEVYLTYGDDIIHDVYEKGVVELNYLETSYIKS